MRSAGSSAGLQAQGAGRTAERRPASAPSRRRSHSAKLRGNPYVELAHFVEQLALSTAATSSSSSREAGVDGSRLAADMTRAIDALPYGATSIAGLLRPHLPRHPGRAGATARCRPGDETVRSAYILLGALKVPVLDGASRQDQRRVRQDRRRRDRRAPGGRCSPARSRAPRRARGRRPRRRPGAGRAANSALAKYATDLTAARPGRQDRPGGGPRPGDPPDHRRADAAAAEQPDPDRRGRGGQDRGGRGLRAAARGRRRAADAEGREPADARRRADAGRREREGRVREAAARR